MSHCWPDGLIRASLDRELPPADQARLSAHLEECPRCHQRRQELSARAERVLGLLAELPEPLAPLARPAPKPVALPRPRPARWLPLAIAAAAALAAGWAALALLAPQPVQAPVEARFPAPPAVEKPAPQPPVEAAVAPPQPLPVRVPARTLPRPSRRAFPPAPAHATLAGFVALDDDPIDAGVVMRVALADGRMQADVLYSPDGRPRAIRMVNDIKAK